MQPGQKELRALSLTIRIKQKTKNKTKNGRYMESKLYEESHNQHKKVLCNS